MSLNLSTEQLLGKQLDEYRLVGVLGQGGMAQVYLAFDINLQRQAALKVINAPFRADADYIERFEREARAIAQLTHPHIVRLYRYGQVGQLLYIAMEYIEGQDLKAMLTPYHTQQKLLPLEDIRRIMRQICTALDYAHNKGVIHRDIKPPNILLDQAANAVLTDFGLVLLDDRQTRGEAFGTPYYIAPEQAISSAGALPQSDLYAMGVILYEMCTGRLPFYAQHAYDLAMLHLSEPPPSPRTINPHLSPAIEAVILKALLKPPEERYQRGASLADALDKAIDYGVGRQKKRKFIPAPIQPLLPGMQLGPYVITNQISHGPKADVYQGYQVGTTHKVVLKLLLLKTPADEENQPYFQQQTQTLITLQHPHLVRIYAIDTYHYMPYLLMDYVAGGTLQSWLAGRKGTDKPIPLPGIERIIRGVAVGLDYAHTHSVVHDNLRPANIMITTMGQVIVTDIGLAQLMVSLDHTAFGSTLHTAAYISPEQTDGKVRRISNDVYALGIILYEMLTGRVPFEADLPLDVLIKHKTEPVPSPLDLNPQLPASIEPVILTALSKQAEDRYQTAGALAQALSQAINHKN